MFKWVLSAAFLLSVLVCAGDEYLALRKLEDRRILIERKRADLAPLGNIDREVMGYQGKKSALRARIDAIIRLKQIQKTASEAVEKLSTIDTTSVESAAVIDGKTLVVNTPSGARTLR